MKGYYKVPGRQVYCNTIRWWLWETFYCHVVLRLSPPETPTQVPYASWMEGAKEEEM